jgi:hypothetical protein
MLDYVADMLGEHPDLIDAIVSNDDNLTWGSIISVSFGLEDVRSAITDDGIDELRIMIAEARRSPDEWDSFLECVVYDDDEMKAIRAHYAA